MGLWQRFTMIFKAKASRTLDRVENPGETLDYSYQKQLEMLQKTKRGLADVVTAKKRLQHQTQGLEQSVVKLDGQARQALSAGRDDLARTALERKVLVQEQLQGLDQQIAGLEEQQRQMVAQQQELSAEGRGLPHPEGSDQGAVLGRRGAGADRRGDGRAVVGAVGHRRRHGAGAGSGGADAGARVRRRGAGLDRRPGRGGLVRHHPRSIARSRRSRPMPRSMPSWTRSARSWPPRPPRPGS